MKILLPLLVLLSSAPVLAVPLSVSVVDDKGKPVVGADVQLESFGKTPRGFVLSQTNEQGAATFDVEPSLEQGYGDFAGRVFANKKGLGIASGHLTFKKPLRIELGPSTKVSGTVIDPEGKPIQGAKISFSSARKNGAYSDTLYDGPLLPQMTTQSGADGSWQLDGVPSEAQVSVSVSAPERVGAYTQILSGGSAQTTLQPGTQIKGRLLGLNGKPLAGVRVVVQGTDNGLGYSGGNTKTGDDGTFLVDGLSSGAFNVMFYTENEDKESFVVPAFQSVNASIGTPLQLPDVRAVQGVMIGGHVLEGAAQTPVVGIRIGVYGGVNPSTSAAVSSASTDENGVWKMRTLPGQSKVYLMGVPLAFKQGTQEQNPLVTDAGNTNIDFNLERLPKITGRLLDEEGKGVKAPIQLRRDNDVFSAFSDEKGDFTAYGPTPGEWQVSSSDGGWGPEISVSDWELAGPARVTVAADKPLEIRLRRAKVESAELGVYDDEDVAVEGASVVVNIVTGEGEGQSMQQRELISDKSGRARIEKLGANQRIEIDSAKKLGYDTAALPKPDHVGHLWSASLTLIKRNERAKGQIFNANGEAVPGTLVAGSGIDTRTDATGYFELAPLPKGVTPVFAWQGTNFALSSSDKTRLDLKPQPLEPTDTAKAKVIIDALIEQAKNKDVEYYRRDSLEFEIGSFDELAQKLQQKPTKRAIETLLARFANDKSISNARWFNLLQIEKDPATRLYNTAQWLKTGPSVEANDDSRKFLLALENDVTESETHLKDPDKWQVVRGLFAAAAFAEKIGDTEAADSLFERARVYADKTVRHELDRGLGIVGPVVAVSPRFLQKTADLIPDTNANHFLILREGVPVLARSVGLDAVKPLLVQIQTAPPSKPDSYGDTFSVDSMWHEATIGAIRAAGKTNPSLALELAKALPTTTGYGDYTARDRALCEAAFFQPPEVAKPLWSQSLPHLSPDTAMAFLVRIKNLDEPFALAQYETLARNMDAQGVPEPGITFWRPTGNIAAFAFYEARFNPARARFRLERFYGTAQTYLQGDGSLGYAAKAMAIFDAGRAVGWTAKLPGAINDWSGNFETRRRIAQWLVLSEEARQHTEFSGLYSQEWGVGAY